MITEIRVLPEKSVLSDPATYIQNPGVLTVNLQSFVISVHDGITPGGIPVNGGGGGGVTSVGVSGGTTGLTTTGGPITNSGTITLTGILSKANGGTGTATPALVPGTNVTITGAWPNQTINAAGGSLNNPALTGAASYSGSLSDISTVEVSWNEGDTYQIPDGVSSVLNTNGVQIYNLNLIMPANPVNGQELTISSLAEIRQPTNSSGNGGTIISPIAGFVAGTSFSYRYRASTKTWVPLVEPIQYESNGSGVRTQVTLTGTGTYQILNHLGLSWGVSLGGASQPLTVSQATADGLSGRGIFLGFQTQNTLDVTNTSSSNGEFSWSGFQAETYNSSIPYGPGATNDDQLIAGLVNTGQMFVGGAGVNWPAWNGAPGGAFNWLSFSSAPLLCGSPFGNGEAFRINNTNCNFSVSKALAITSEDRDTGTSNFTVANNVTNVILAGSGTVQVMMPAIPVDGQLVNITLETNYSGVTVTNNSGQTIITGAAIGSTSGSFATFRYRLANTKWYRVG